MAQQFGVIGLEVMGKNIALNIERNGFPVAVYNRTWEKTETFMKERAEGLNVYAAKTLEDFVKNIEKPRRILVMVKAGGPVDAVLQGLKPLLEPGDIVIDGGNSKWEDTDRRVKECDPTGIKFFGMGISGGEHGALWGPSLMPGGDKATYKHLEPVLQKISAKAGASNDSPCVTYCGAGSAGHFVKMVHNGIEYGDMQLIAESYDLMRHGLGMSTAEIEKVFVEWNNSELSSFLIEITSKLVNFTDDQGTGKPLVDLIVDKAGQKGTGKWTTMAALEVGVPIPTMTAAVDARILSSFKDIRTQMSEAFGDRVKKSSADKAAMVKAIRSALYASKLCSYAQGFHLLQQASAEKNYGINFGECARIWRGGCIIRAVFLDRITEAFNRNPELPNLILDGEFKKEMESRTEDWRTVVKMGVDLGIGLPAMSASLAYFDNLLREKVPANIIQAQRDFFGSHTYERTDKEGLFHTKWTPDHN